MTLELAKHYAGKIVEWLAPYCDRIEVAGSVRRERLVCNDIDLVVIPKFAEGGKDMFGVPVGERVNLVHSALLESVRVGAGRKWIAGEKNSEGSNFIVQLAKCQLDVYVATEINWGSKLVQRTGSKEHNIWLASRARSLGYSWELERGIVGVHTDRELGVGVTEEAVYKVLEMDFIPPQDREGGRLERYVWKTKGRAA